MDKLNVFLFFCFFSLVHYVYVKRNPGKDGRKKREGKNR